MIYIPYNIEELLKEYYENVVFVFVSPLFGQINLGFEGWNAMLVNLI